ncbi:hypothetical protein MauCBS54593_001978 [Microsporum audouinii]
MLPIPRLESRSQLNLTWPPAVKYTHPNTCPNGVTAPSISGAKTSHGSLLVGKSKSLGSFPEVTTEGDIRLLRLRPGQNDDPIHGEIELLSLKDDSQSPSYLALSYASSDEYGGLPTKSCPVYVGLYWDVIYTTKNCGDALRAVRHQGTDLPVWVDAVCIDQQDIDDKTRQVSLMRDIYTKALKVMVFAGNPSSDSDVALDLLAMLAKGPSVSSRVAATKEKSQIALKALIKRPCFSRLWVTQEVFLARNLEILCGNHSETWPSLSSLPSGLRNSASFSLLARKSGDMLTHTRLLFEHAMSHDCLDPRDKIFAVLALLHKEGIRPDYSLPVEVVYTGITAYLLQNCLAFWPLSLLGMGKRGSGLPSWVPDWSQPLSLGHIDLEHNAKVGFPHSQFFFDFYNPQEPGTQPGHKIKVSTNGSLITLATKLCDISPMDKVIPGPDHQRIIVLNRGCHGNLLIPLVDKEYEIGEDSIFFLDGPNYPVILRGHPGTNTYSFVSVCDIFLVKPENELKWRVPCGLEVHEWPLKVPLRLSSESNKAIQDFHASLLELCGVERTHTPEDTDADLATAARTAVLDFWILSLTDFRTLESRLRARWQACHDDLRWIFRDQAAIWKLIRDMDQGDQNDISGVGSMGFGDQASLGKNYSIDYWTEYTWDLRRFLWSFLNPNTGASEDLDGAYNPVYEMLKVHIPEIRSWAEVTEKLMNAIDFLRAALGNERDFFPGVDLPNKWRSRWENFSRARSAEDRPENEAFNSECYWDWPAFERCLELRDTLLAQDLPPALDITENLEVRSHLVLRILGLRLDAMTTVEIV